MSFDPDEIAEMFSELSLGETGGVHPIEYAAAYQCERWRQADEERRKRREVDEAFWRHERRRWARANHNRKLKRRGDHLTNLDRVKAYDSMKRGEKSLGDIQNELGVSQQTAGSIGQLRLF